MNAARREMKAVLIAAMFGALLFAALTRTLLEHVPTYDELLHVMAARGVVATGEPVMGSGEYRRAELYTRAVALAYRLHGDNLVSARLPSWLSGIALVALIGGWVTRRRGLMAGLASAGVLAITPALYEAAVLARFYVPHALLIFGALIALFEAATPARHGFARGVLLALALLCFAFAWHLQVSTIIGIGAGIAGVLAVVACDRWKELTAFAAKHRTTAVVTVGVIFLVGSLLLWTLGAYLLHGLGDAPLWAGNRQRVDFYARMLRDQLPLLAPLLPVAAVVTFGVDRRLALFCLAAALAGFIVHTIAPFKASRYALYLMPLLAVLWGCALAVAVEAISRAIRERGLMKMSASAACVGALAAVGLVLANSAEGVRAAKLLLGKARLQDVLPYVGEGDWRRAAVLLAPHRKQARTVVVSSGVKALYALGDYDYELNASVVPESESGKEFGRDPRTGRHVISTEESLSRVLDESASALIVADAEKVGDPAGITPPVVHLLETRCQRIDGLESARVAAWTCR